MNDFKRNSLASAGGLFIFGLLLALAIVLHTGLRAAQPDRRAPAEEAQTVQARVVRVIATTTDATSEPARIYQQLEIEIQSGFAPGTRRIIDHDTSEGQTYYAGDHVLVVIAATSETPAPMMFIADFVRTGPLILLAAILVAAIILVSGWKGARALIGLAISLVVIIGFIVPLIAVGFDPVIVSVIGSFGLLAATLYLTQGWTLKTHAALLGVLCSLILTGTLATLAVQVTRLTGFGSEESVFLQVANASINARGLLLAGIIVGTLGVLDDVIVSQSSAVIELAHAQPALGWRELYRRAMNIGHDHIAATINTLALAYVGAALPLLLLFQVYPEPWAQTLSREMIAEEIVRTLVGTLGLVAALPITTLIASLLRARQRALDAPETLA